MSPSGGKVFGRSLRLLSVLPPAGAVLFLTIGVFLPAAANPQAAGTSGSAVENVASTPGEPASGAGAADATAGTEVVFQPAADAVTGGPPDEGPHAEPELGVPAESAAGLPAEDSATSPRPSGTDLLRADLAREIERASLTRTVLDRLEDRLRNGIGEEQQRATASSEQIGALTSELRSAGQGNGAADAVYGRIVSELVEARPLLREALDRWNTPPAPEGFVPSLDLETLKDTSLAGEATGLETMLAEIADASSRQEALEKEAAWQAVDLRGERVTRLNSLRLEALADLSSSKRSAILGISRAGIAQLRREIEQLTLASRLYVATRLRNLHRVPEMLRDVFAVGSATYTLLKALLLIGAWLFLLGRRRDLLDRLRRWLTGRARGFRATRRARMLSNTVEAVAPWSLFLGVLLVLRWLLAEVAAWPEFQLPYRIAFIYGAYRLAIDVVVALIVSGARRYRLRLDQERREKLLRSVRTIMRVFAMIAVLLAISEQFLGRGYLFSIVVRFAWIVVLVAVFRVLASWREITADAYLKLAPEGRLAALVGSTKGRWYGVFVGAASLAWLAGRAAAVLAQDFALGFDQTRKALAFLFRRRMEKQAEKKGYAEGKIEDLPAALRDAFSEKGPLEKALAIEHFPGLDELHAAIADWKRDRRGGSFLLTGQPGMGKTSWLSRVDGGDLPVKSCTLDKRLMSGGELVAFLSRALLPGKEAPDGVAALETAIFAQPPGIVMLDVGQNLFLGTVGGYEAFERFVGLVEATCHHIFWVCAFNAFAWEHLSAVRPDLAVFRHHATLTPWSEKDIRDLIRTRTAVSGVTLTYEDLVVERMEGIQADARILETEEGYTRLLWDYSDGNPRVALHFWLRSLVPESGTKARVRLFRAPAAETLETGGEPGLFILAAVVGRENLTAPETAAVTRYPESVCRVHLHRFVEMGVMRADGGRYRVTTHWNRAAVRLLARKNLVAD